MSDGVAEAAPGRNGSRTAARLVGASLAPLLAAVALVAAATTVPALVREIVDAPPAAERWSRPELYPPHVSIPTDVVVRSEQLMPEDALYAIAIGDQYAVADHGIGVLQALNYFLLPRRWTFDVREAEWIITWGHSSETLGVRIEREWGLSTGPPGVNLVKVRR